MHNHIKLKSLRNAIVFFILATTFPILTAQTEIGVHSHLVGQTYRDDKIEVTAPQNWTIATETGITSGTSQLTFDKGAVLKHGRYILSLCTGCSQASGVIGGRFSEIVTLVQPWFRDGYPDLPCGDRKMSEASPALDRVDFWYTRNADHPSKVADSNCNEPQMTATVWYGSYFTRHCPNTKTEDEDCGGFFLVNMTHQPKQGLNEMAFGLTYDTTDPNQLPYKNDPELTKVLAEANAIAASIHYLHQPPLQTPSH